MYSIYRHVGGISLNGNEFLLNDDNSLKLFDSLENALDFIGFDSMEQAEENGIYIQLEK